MPPSIRALCTRCLLACAALAALPVFAQDDPPGRVARLGYQDAPIQWTPSGSVEWATAEANWPFTRGDRLRVPSGVRAELQTGSTTLRVQGPSQLEISALEDATMRVTLMEGSLSLSVRSLLSDERIEVNTGNLALVVSQPGEFRIDTDPAGNSTQVSARSGAGTLYGEGGEAAPIAGPGQARYTGRRLTPVAMQTYAGRDTFDEWVAERNRAEDQSTSARYLSRDIIGYQELDANGDWLNDPTYGAVWVPRVTIAAWAPYRYGQWRWIDPWGWTWIDDARWGFAPFHYGRWIQTGPRWAWVPGPMTTRRPIYAPALVGFEGGPPHAPPRRPGPGERLRLPERAWFPLAPGEAWRPTYNASQRYLNQINRGATPPSGSAGQTPRYAYQRRPDAVTTRPERDPDSRRPLAMPGRGFDDGQRNAGLVPRPPEPRAQEPRDPQGRPSAQGELPRDLRPDESPRNTHRERMPSAGAMPGIAPQRPQPQVLPPQVAPPLAAPSQMPPQPRMDGPARSQAEQEQRAQRQREQFAERERMQREQNAQRERAQQQQAVQQQQQQQAQRAQQQAAHEQMQRQMQQQMQQRRETEAPQPRSTMRERPAAPDGNGPPRGEGRGGRPQRERPGP